jgi:hypothetical protein
MAGPRVQIAPKPPHRPMSTHMKWRPEQIVVPLLVILSASNALAQPAADIEAVKAASKAFYDAVVLRGSAQHIGHRWLGRCGAVIRRSASRPTRPGTLKHYIIGPANSTQEPPGSIRLRVHPKRHLGSRPHFREFGGTGSSRLANSSPSARHQSHRSPLAGPRRHCIIRCRPFRR